MSYVAFWGLLFSFGCILFKGRHWWRIALLMLSGLLVALVGPSRVYLGPTGQAMSWARTC